MALGVKQH